MSRFDGKVVVITGGGGGMGVELCAAFAERGAHVVLTDAVERAVREGAAELERRGHAVETLVLDVADEPAVAAAFDGIVAAHGHVDALVCAAGVRPVGRLLEQSLEDWDRCLRINLTGVLVCARNAARHMVARGSGSIVNIASVNGVRAVTGLGAYNASKAAVISLTQTLASELGPHNVRVNAIVPAQVETPMIAGDPPDERRRREERIPMGRYGTPREIATAACFLASDDASFVTGHPLAVDGGYLAFGFRPAAFG